MSDFKHLYMQEYNINCLKEMFIDNNLKIIQTLSGALSSQDLAEEP